MIKLERDFTPEFFLREDLKSLTSEYKDSGKAVWHHPEVKSGCLKLGHGKCAFCEVKLEEASTYNEVEHFKDKKKYPDDVISWENLLPSCRHCNGSKQSHDVVNSPIINPCHEIPSDHLFIRGYRIRGKTDLGVQTVEVLNFNQREHKFIPRCKAGDVIESSLDDALYRLESYLKEPSVRRKNILKNKIEAILEECQITASFSAVSATVLHGSSDYIQIREAMIANDIWTDHMQKLHDNALLIRLPEIR